MPAPTLVANTLPQWTVNGTPTPPLPTGWAAGDVLVAAVYCRGAGTTKPTIDLLAGWSDVSYTNAQGDTSTVSSMRIMAKVAQAGETAPTFTASQAATHPTGAMLVAVRGGDLASIVQSGFIHSVSTTLNPASVATAGADNLLLLLGGSANDCTGTVPAGFANLLDGSTITGSGAAQTTTAGSDAGMQAFSGSAPTAGTYDPDAITLSQSPTSAHVITLAIAPPSGPAAGSVTADADSSHTVDSAPFTVAAVGTPGGGTYDWTQAGTVATLAGANTATVTVTPPSTAGTTTLTVTYDPGTGGATDSEDVVLTWTLPAPPTGAYTTAASTVVDASASTGDTALTETSAHGVTITETATDVYQVDHPSPFDTDLLLQLVTTDAYGQTDTDVITITPSGGTAPAASGSRLVYNGSAWV